MNLLKCIPVTLILIASSVANAQPTYLTGSKLRSAIEGQTLLAKDWAEFYALDGTIFGKVHYWGTHDYTGKWTAYQDRICYDYPQNKQSNTCSRLTLNGNKVTHYTLKGEQKNDGVTLRKSGNALNQFK